tara:strand:- start:9223 stop:9897 length:675 start_codon:yes stop_codon:yes gene_type:complete
MKFVHEKIEMGYETLDRVEAADGRRYVTLEGKNYPSVTTVLNLVHRDKIQEWRKRVGEDKANQISVQATNRGTAVHSIIEKYLHGEDTSDFLPHIQQSLQNLKPLIDKHVTKVFATECPLYSDHLQLAGTCDAIVEWDNVPTILDWKTSKRPKKKTDIGNYFMQLSAYAVMWEERTGMPCNQTRIVMDVDNFHPVMYKETRDEWIDKMIYWRDEYNKELMFGHV